MVYLISLFKKLCFMTVVENKTQEQVFKLNQGNTLRLSYVTLEPRPSLPGPLPAHLRQLTIDGYKTQK